MRPYFARVKCKYMSRHSDDVVAGAMVLGFLVGAASFYISAALLTSIGLGSGHIKLIDFRLFPTEIQNWDIGTILISVSIAVLTFGIVFRRGVKSGR